MKICWRLSCRSAAQQCKSALIRWHILTSSKWRSQHARIRFSQCWIWSSNEVIRTFYGHVATSCRLSNTSLYTCTSGIQIDCNWKRPPWRLCQLLLRSIELFIGLIIVCPMHFIAALDRIYNHLRVRCLVSGVRCTVRVWKTSNGHNSATRHPIDFVFGSIGWGFSKDGLALFNLTAHELHELYYDRPTS